MTIFSRLLGLGLLTLLLAMLVMSCETSKRGSGEYSIPSNLKSEGIPHPESQQIAQITDSTLQFKTPRKDLATAFIKEFGDGTVVDKIMIRKAPAGPKEPVNYYLVGMGLRNGLFRAMALRLTPGGDNTVYLRPTSERYILTGVGCTMCFFNFENGRIVGTSCDSNSGGSRCDLKVENNNYLFVSAADKKAIDARKAADMKPNAPAQ